MSVEQALLHVQQYCIQPDVEAFTESGNDLCNRILVLSSVRSCHSHSQGLSLCQVSTRPILLLSRPEARSRCMITISLPMTRIIDLNHRITASISDVSANLFVQVHVSLN